MKADNTRSTFNQASHYRSVRMQQGRVQLDADWNEQADIASHRVETETLDVIGSCGGPMDGAGFGFNPQGNDLQITAGRYYVDGILCENEAIVLASDQPDLPPNAPIVKGDASSVAFLSAPSGVYIAYMDVWSRHITALDDPLIREVALGGPDTATRSKTIWQVKFLEVDNPDARCLDSFDSWNDLIAAPTGQLAARTSLDNPDPDPCIVAPGAGYRRLENQLYRVEIHKPGAIGTATFKWSRDNGSIATSWTGENNELTVSSIGRDKALNFASGQWIELSDDARDLMGQPGTLVRLVKAEGNVLTIDPTTAIPSGSVNLSDFSEPRKVRRWDSDGEMDVKVPATNEGWIALEDGVEIQFKAETTYRSGDYWLIPARTATADVEWPKAASNPLSLPPKGIEHHYCRLAVVKFDVDAGIWSVLGDCRSLFPSLDQAPASLYPVSQTNFSALPNQSTTVQLRVVASSKSGPVPGMQVTFTVITTDGGHVDPPTPITTDPNGLASCNWTLGTSLGTQVVEAELLANPDHPTVPPTKVFFTAQRSAADDPGFHVTGLVLPSDASPLLNNTDLEFAKLDAGIQILCDDDVDPVSVANRPVVFVTLERPEPFLDPAITRVGAYQILVLPGVANANQKTITWKPASGAMNFLAQMFADLNKVALPARVLARFTAKGNFIWATGKPDVYLDGEAFGLRPGVNANELRFGGDQKRGGDFEMWFWLTAPRSPLGPGLLKVKGVLIRSGTSISKMTNPQEPLIVILKSNGDDADIEIQFTSSVDIGTVLDGTSFVVKNPAGKPVKGDAIVPVKNDTIKWVTRQAFSLGTYEVTLLGDEPKPIKSPSGSPLDGETLRNTLPSGDDRAGGNFTFHFEVRLTA